MTKYVVERAIQAVIVAWLISLATFILFFTIKDPARAMAGPEATAEDIERLRVALRLDRPLHEQYFAWLGSALKLDLGRSLYSSEPVTSMIARRLPPSLLLAGTALAITIVVGIPLGILAAVRRGTLIDLGVTLIGVIGQAMPIFWFGLMLIMLFAVTLGWFPVGGRGTWRHLVMPAIALAYWVMPLMLRLARSSMLEVLGQDYIRTARAKGLNERVVVMKHALRNAAIPLVTIIGLQFGALLGGTIVTETVFAWPGIGEMVVTSVMTGDLPVVQGTVLLLGVWVVLMNLLADIALVAVDPRVRYE